MKLTQKNIQFLLLFTLSFTWFYVWGKGVFFYQENSSLFIYSIEYLQKFTSRPGGLLVWTGNFLIQGYFSSLYGSILISSFIVAAACITLSIIKRCRNESHVNFALSLLPAMILFLIASQYEYHLYHIIGFLAAITWFLAAISFKKYLYRLILLSLFPLLYYLIGPFSFVFAGAFITWNLLYFSGRKYRVSVLFLAYCILTFILFRQVIFFQPDKVLLGYPMIFNENRMLTVINVSVSVLLVFYPAFLRLLQMIKNETAILKYSGFILFPLAMVALVLQYNPATSDVLKLEKSVHEQDWNAVIREYEQAGRPNIVSQYFYDLSLSETGQLCSRMFFADQSSGPLALSLDGNRNQAFRTIYFYYCIGLINEAHHLAYETMVRHGYTPENLKMLIKTELLRGNYQVARNYLDKMKKTLHYKRWAEKYTRMAADTTLIRKDPELGRKLIIMPREDFFVGSGNLRNIELLLRSNPDNRIAFEYRVAWSLLEKDIIAASNDAIKMNDSGGNIPRHVEEAIVAYRNISDEAPDNSRVKVNPETEKRFFLYRKTVEAYKGNKTILMEKMGKAERNTFWFYMQFSTIKSDFLKSMPAEKNIN